MALHFPLKVNNETIGVFEAVRVADTPTPGVYEYAVTIRASKTIEFLLEHRYDDGAWELVRKALNHADNEQVWQSTRHLPMAEGGERGE